MDCDDDGGGGENDDDDKDGNDYHDDDDDEEEEGDVCLNLLIGSQMQFTIGIMCIASFNPSQERRRVFFFFLLRVPAFCHEKQIVHD